ncbi:hypothetical protein BKA69DRAFT_1069663 [Paraphysoderma sedebokerense]|nr:hypothetical protein BKA69DRAFT_1069663 [Paraphysoderma sedebokerense]
MSTNSADDTNMDSRLLPAPEDIEKAKEIAVNGASAKLDELGPVVVNADGSISRITNWKEMTEHERKTTVRLVAKRNKERLDVLKAREQNSKV